MVQTLNAILRTIRIDRILTILWTWVTRWSGASFFREFAGLFESIVAIELDERRRKDTFYEKLGYCHLDPCKVIYEAHKDETH